MPDASQCQMSTAAPRIGLQLETSTTVVPRLSATPGLPSRTLRRHLVALEVVRALRLLGREHARHEPGRDRCRACTRAGGIVGEPRASMRSRRAPRRRARRDAGASRGASARRPARRCSCSRPCPYRAPRPSEVVQTACRARREVGWRWSGGPSAARPPPVWLRSCAGRGRARPGRPRPGSPRAGRRHRAGRGRSHRRRRPRS